MPPLLPAQIPKFRDKLRKLYEWAWRNEADPEGNVGNARLARTLGNVGPTAIAMWVTGVEPFFKTPESFGTARVPRAHFEAICNDIFGVPEDVFAGDYPGFCEWLRRNPHIPPATWKDFTAGSEVTKALHLTRRAAGLERGLALPVPNDSPAERYHVDDEVCIELDLPTLAPSDSQASERSLILIVEDASTTACIYPSSNALMIPKCLAAGTHLRLPQDPSAWIRVTSPIGIQSLYALVTERSLSLDVTNELMAGVLSPGQLNRLARRISAREFGWFKALKQTYAVV